MWKGGREKTKSVIGSDRQDKNRGTGREGCRRQTLRLGGMEKSKTVVRRNDECRSCCKEGWRSQTQW